MVEVKEINSNSKTKGLVYWTGLVPHGGIRNAIQNQQGRITGPARRSSKWTGDEDKILADAVKRYNSRNWKKIAECVPDRTDVQCLHRWQKVLDPKLVKGPWKKEEDDLIRELVETHGNKKWSQIAKHLPGRIGKQCRERWHNHLNPDINRTSWTKEEEAILIKAHGAYGNKWAEIAKLLQGRTENSIKNHWNCSVRKRIESYPACGLDLYSYRTEADGKKLEVGKQRNDRGMNLCSNVEPCSLDLVLGNVGRREGQSVAPDNEISKIAEKVLVVHTHLSQPTIPPLISLEISAIFLSGGLMRSPNSQERTRETANTVDSLPSEALSSSLDLSLSTPFSSRGYDETMDEHEKNIGAGGPNTSDKLHHGLCYESLQLKDLNVFPETGSFPSTDCYIGGPGSFTTPVSRNRVSPNCSSPESRLRSKARSFKSTPSIIRKRSSVTLRQAGSSDKDDNGLRSLGSCSSDKDGDDGVDLLNKKKLFLSPPKSKKLETSEGMKSVEKRLEDAFNI
ncbi:TRANSCRIPTION REPRESSOR MYB5 [Salix koriyanagi]|uniref:TRANSCRIPTION REPRESSOR MYB5 n=1 Tax=Salix koriyanagi TaxID=2511006 RepID=A0A9Q0U3V1_9ROSI|nr:TRANSCRIPTION REPRESSOR MYB5 [Salix koriyanagi]